MTKNATAKSFTMHGWPDGTFRSAEYQDDPAALGAYEISYYTSGFSTTGIGSARVYYPLGLASPAPATIWIGGLSNDINQSVEESGGYTWSDNFEFGIWLAKHGFPSIHLNPTDLGTDPPGRETAFDNAMTSMIAENARVGSPLYGKLLTNKFILMGHSFGAGGAFRAAVGNSNVAGVFGLSPVFNGQGYPSSLDKPSMMFHSTADGLEDYNAAYASLPPGNPRIRAQYGSPTGYEGGHDAGRAFCSSLIRSVAGVTTEHPIDPIMRQLVTAFVQVYGAGRAEYASYFVTGTGLSSFSYVP